MLSFFRFETEEVRAEPTLFIHGFMGRGSEWQSIAESLGGPVWAVDLPGHGCSTQMQEMDYGFDRTLEMLEEGFDSNGIENANLVGYSMGGRIALGLALTAPARVGCLILESASPGLRLRTEREVRRGLDRQRASELRTDFDQFLRGWYEMPLFATLRDDPERLASIMVQRKEGSAEEFARALIGLGTGSQPDYWDRLGELTAETHVMAGSRDHRYCQVAREMVASNSRMQEIIVPEAGHNIHLECPIPYLQALKDILS